MGAEIEVVVAAVTGAITGGAVKPVLAPAEALAEHWKDRIKTRLDTVGRAARRKTGTPNLAVNERVAYRVLTEAAFTDDQVVVEYLAGVIAGSGPDSDDGTPVLAQIGRLSGFQLRLHYLIYRAYIGRHRSPSWFPRLFLSSEELARALGQPFDELRPRLVSAGAWLRREGLLATAGSDGWGHDDSFRLMERDEAVVVGGGERGSRREARVPDEPGLLVIGTEYGLDLFLWGCGKPRIGDVSARTAAATAVFEPPIPECHGRVREDMREVPFEQFEVIERARRQTS